MTTTNPHNLRSRDRVDYAALHDGRLDPSAALDAEQDVFHDSFSDLPRDSTSSPTPPSRSTDARQALADQLAAAKAERQSLTVEAELRAMQEELASIQAENKRLKAKATAPLSSPAKGGVPSVDQVRSIPDVSARVAKELDKLGIDFTASDESSSAEDDDLERRKTKKRSEGKKSGKLSKVTSRIVQPQLWPQSELSISYVSKDVKYDDLSFPEFVAGYSSILSLPSLPSQEKQARMEHLTTLMYLAAQFPWPMVRDFHAAVLFEIERGRAYWGDSFHHLENRFLHRSYAGKAGSSGSGDKSSSARGNFYCKEWQTGKCSHKNDHYGLIRNERKWVKHICGKCFRTDQTISRHPESSSTCPLQPADSSSPKPSEE